MSIPTKFRAGDTLKFTESIDGYLSSEYSLVYTLLNANHKYTITTVSDGDGYSAIVASSVTTNYEAGDYTYVAHAIKDDERYQVLEGYLSISPDFTKLDTLDVRSHAKKVLEAIEAILENKATLDQESYQINGRSLKRRSIDELMMLRAKYKSELRLEDEKSGYLTRKKAIYTRFTG